MSNAANRTHELFNDKFYDKVRDGDPAQDGRNKVAPVDRLFLVIRLLQY